MAARPLHVFEAGVVTEQQFAGLQEAPAILGPALAERLGAEKRVRIPFNPRDRWLTAAREACRTLADGVQASLREGATAAVIGGECTVIAGALGGALSAEPVRREDARVGCRMCPTRGGFPRCARPLR